MNTGEVANILSGACGAAEAAAATQQVTSDELVILSQLAGQMQRDADQLAERIGGTMQGMQENISLQVSAKEKLDESIASVVAASEGTNRLDSAIGKLASSSNGAGEVIGQTAGLLESLPEARAKLQGIVEYLGTFMEDITGINSKMGRNIAHTRAANSDITDFAEKL